MRSEIMRSVIMQHSRKIIKYEKMIDRISQDITKSHKTKAVMIKKIDAKRRYSQAVINECNVIKSEV